LKDSNNEIWPVVCSLPWPQLGHNLRPTGIRGKCDEKSDIAKGFTQHQTIRNIGGRPSRGMNKCGRQSNILDWFFVSRSNIFFILLF
jgi:hypothetical protein